MLSQGSTLGPLLLMNDLEINRNTLLYADDTTLVNSSRDLATLEVEAAASYKEVVNWFTLNNLQLNVDKTQTLLCSLWTRQPATDYNSHEDMST